MRLPRSDREGDSTLRVAIDSGGTFTDAVRFLRQVIGAVLVSLTWPGHLAFGEDPSAVVERRKIERETLDLARRLVFRDPD